MALSINTNLASHNAQRHLQQSGSTLATSMQRLSSGLRVNSAKDDAAGLAIAERMHAQTRGLGVAARNATDGISLAQTAEGALGKMGDMLQRMRALAVQSANATNSDSDRQALQSELGQLRSEIDRVAKTTTFNGQHLLNGRFAGGVFQVGAHAGEQITVGDITNAQAHRLGQVTYGASTTGPIQASAITDLSAIAAGTLKIRIGTQEEVSLDAIAAASSGQERLGQIVAAINAKTADTGLSAFLVEDRSTPETYTVELRRQGTEGVAISGFTAAATGVGRNPATTSLGISAAVEGEYTLSSGFLADLQSRTLLTNGTNAYALAPQLNPQHINLVHAYLYDYQMQLSAQASASIDQAFIEFANVIVPLAYGDQTANTPATKLDPNLPGADPQRWRVLVDGGSPSEVATVLQTIQDALGALSTTLTEALGDQQNITLQRFDDSYKHITTTHTWTQVNAAVSNLNTQLVNDLGGTALNIPTLTANSSEADIQAVREMVMANASSLVNGGFGITTQQIHTYTGLEDIAITTQAGAWEALVHMDAAIDQVNRARADLGALQTRFEKSIDNIQIMQENTAAARSRIVDADYAQETAQLSRTQILQQAGTAMVAQANQLPQNVLSLLR